MSLILSRSIPLSNVKELGLFSYRIIVDDLMKLLRFTPNLEVLGLEALIVDEPTLNLRRKRKNFKYIASTKKIKDLRINARCSLKKMQFLAYLFPNLDYLTTSFSKNEVRDVFRLVLTKPHQILQNLFFLRINSCPETYADELNDLIRSEHLVDDYLFKVVNYTGYFWF